MKLRLRRVGNSLGVIIPKHLLDQWGLAEGAELELTADGIFFDAEQAARLSHEVASGSIWDAKRQQQAAETATGKSHPIFGEELAKRAIIVGSPL